MALTTTHTKSRVALSSAVLSFFVILTLIVTYLLYTQVQDFFKQRLREQIRAIAATASVQFDPDELDQITGPESVGTPVYERTVLQLQKIRAANNDITFAYIWRQTEDPNTVVFVADADSLDPWAKIDLNGDGTIDEADALNLPGDPYDISELEFFDEFREQAFKHPFADPELSKDQWAWLISGSAPIFRKDGTADELVAVDVVVTDFVHVTNLALVPFVLFILFLLLVLCTQTAMLVRLWGSQVRLLQELDRQKDELLSIVSHQLAAPVTSIKWYLEMLQEGDLGVLKKEQQESLQSMQSVTADLSDLVGLILDVSRIQLGRMKSDRSATDLAVFFKEILAVIEPKAKEKGVHFTKMLPAHLPTVMLDKRLTRMTVENLLTNAVKYTPAKGRVELLVEKRDSTLHCEVRDTGCGIPKEEQSKIFDKLFRASNVRDKVDGNGFGLYIAKGGIESQGGKIWFESEEGKGTTFMIELPLVTAAAGSA